MIKFFSVQISFMLNSNYQTHFDSHLRKFLPLAILDTIFFEYLILIYISFFLHIFILIILHKQR